MDRLGFVSLLNANGGYSISMLKVDEQGSLHTSSRGRNLIEVVLSDLDEEERRMVTAHSEERNKKIEEGNKRKERLDRIKFLDSEEENQESEGKSNVKKSFIGKYVRIYTGKYSDMIGRVTCTSSLKKSSIINLVILDNSNCQNNKHTTMASNKFEEIFDNYCNENEKLLIKNDIETLNRKKIEKIEKSELLFNQKTVEINIDDKNTDTGDIDNIVKPIKSSMLIEIPSDALGKDKYIRIKTGNHYSIDFTVNVRIYLKT
jgi:hypothetical protein